MKLSRRNWVGRAGLASAWLASRSFLRAASQTRFRFNYLLASSLYGYARLEEILPQVPVAGASAIDIWPKVHGDQREQLDELGEAAFAALLRAHSVALGCITQYKLGPLKLQDEMRLAQRLGCRTIVCGAVGPTDLAGPELKQAVAGFVEQMKPHLAVAEETGVTIAIENHGKNLICSPDSMRYLAELSPPNLRIAFAPYHLPQDEVLLAELLKDIVDCVAVFYAWQYGSGSSHAQPKEDELQQLPGRGPLDFAPLVSVLQQAHYQGWTEIFMHPFPRGLPMLETVEQVTAELNRSRTYLDGLLAAG